MAPSPPHFPKHALSVKDFLWKPAIPSPPKGGKGKKRNLSISPTSNQNPQKIAKSSPTLTTKPKSKNSNLNPSSMDSDLLEMDLSANVGPSLTDAEAAAMLEDSPPHPVGSPLTDQDESPTAAMKTALEAKMNEEMGEFDKSRVVKLPLPFGTDDCGAIDSGNRGDAACVDADREKQVATEGSAVGSCFGPTQANNAPEPNSIKPTLKNVIGPQGTGNQRDPRIPKDHAAQAGDSGTYADRAKSKIRPEELGKFILHIYSTYDRKNSLSLKDWNQVDEQLIRGLVNHPEPIQIVSSSYNAKHCFGYVACKDLESQDWVKGLVRGMGGNEAGYRAWSRDEKPIMPVCRLFLPSRFDSLDDATAIAQLYKYNPFFQSDSINLKGSEIVQGGRAIYLEFNPETYVQIKNKEHRLGFLATYVDCQLWTQSGPKRKVGLGRGVEGVQRLAPGPAQGAARVPPHTIPKDPNQDPGCKLTRTQTSDLPPTSQTTSDGSLELAMNGDQVGEGKKKRRNRGGRSKKRNNDTNSTTNNTLNNVININQK